MTRRIATPFAQELLDKATPEWDGDVSPDGIPCLTGWVPDATEPSGKRHVVIAEFRGTNDMLDLALASNAADLARSLIETEAERDALRATVRDMNNAEHALGVLRMKESESSGSVSHWALIRAEDQRDHLYADLITLAGVREAVGMTTLDGLKALVREHIETSDAHDSSETAENYDRMRDTFAELREAAK